MAREPRYFNAQEFFLPDSPEYLLYVAIYQVKKDLRTKYPGKNPYKFRDRDGRYVLLEAISNLVLLLAAKDLTEMRDVYDEVFESLNQQELDNDFSTQADSKE